MFVSSADNKRGYVSCIKINGVSILPPLITPERSKELRIYREKAVQIENGTYDKSIKKCLEHILNFEPLLKKPSPLKAIKHSSQTPSKTTKGSLSYKDYDCDNENFCISEAKENTVIRATAETGVIDNSHVEALGIAEPLSNHKIKALHLTRNIVDVTEYNSNGVTLIEQKPECNVSITASDKRNICNLSGNAIEKNKKTDKQPNIPNEDNDCKPRPRLIRSNSYTLDSPSPILLAHLKQQIVDGAEGASQKLFPVTRNWFSLDSSYVPFGQNELNFLNNSKELFCEDDKDDINVTSSAAINIGDSASPKTNKNESGTASPTVEVIQTDISVQHITVNAALNDNNHKNKSEHMKNNTKIFDIQNTKSDGFISKYNDVLDVEDQLIDVLKNIPEGYSKQIIDLLQNQKFEQQKRLDNYKNYKKQLLVESPIKNCVPLVLPNDTAIDKNIGFRNVPESKAVEKSPLIPNSNMSLTSSQSLYYSVESELETAPTTPMKLIDLEDESESEITEEYAPKNSLRKMNSQNCMENSRNCKNINLSRELFPYLDKIKQNREEWAASKIGSAVKGYLVRRLLKTEKVQSLVETIKDALLCALQLHGATQIEESDVELHRRLIQQVSAACYAFHDIFFSLSVKDKMQIISMDRQRRLEKAKRPVSAPSSRTSTSSRRSATPRIRPIGQTPSLTKV